MVSQPSIFQRQRALEFSHELDVGLDFLGQTDMLQCDIHAGIYPASHDRSQYRFKPRQRKE